MRTIYLDYAATTPIDPIVAAKMRAHMEFDGIFGNPASRSHAFGWQAEEAVEAARVQIAEVLNADPREIVWTSGATESNNLAIKGLAENASRRHIVTSKIEHKAVLDPCHYLAQKGFEITFLQPDKHGQINPEQVADAVREDTLLVSLMHVNNELGTINDIAACAAASHSKGALFHTDAAQGFGKIPIDVQQMDIDLLSISGHKIYGPKGIGALFVRGSRAMQLTAQTHGGGHEMGMRSGTLPTHQIVGLGAAAERIVALYDSEQQHLQTLRDIFLRRIQQLPDVFVHTHPERRFSGIMNIGFAGIDGETLLLAMDKLAVSSGSACTSASVEPSHVLRGIGLDDAIAHASLRFSFGRFSSSEDAELAAIEVATVVERLRG